MQHNHNQSFQHLRKKLLLCSCIIHYKNEGNLASKKLVLVKMWNIMIEIKKNIHSIFLDKNIRSSYT